MYLPRIEKTYEGFYKFIAFSTESSLKSQPIFTDLSIMWAFGMFFH